MKTKTSLLLLTLTTTLGLAGPVTAKQAAAPEELSCSFDRGMVVCNWNGTQESASFQAAASDQDATSYRWEVTAEYDVDYDDEVVDRKKKFYYETGTPSWTQSPSAMAASFNGEDGKGVVTKNPMSANVRVKAMYSEKGNDKGNGFAKGGRGKSSPYSGMAEVAFEEDTCPIGMCRP